MPKVIIACAHDAGSGPAPPTLSPQLNVGSAVGFAVGVCVGTAVGAALWKVTSALVPKRRVPLATTTKGLVSVIPLATVCVSTKLTESATKATDKTTEPSPRPVL